MTGVALLDWAIGSLVALTGACGSCPMSAMTMKWTVEKFLLDTVPGVVSVEQA